MTMSKAIAIGPMLNLIDFIIYLMNYYKIDKFGQFTLDYKNNV